MKLPFKIDIVSLPIILFKNRGRHLTINTHPILFGIYKITSPNGGIYIGLSNDIYYRFHSCYKLLSCKEQKKIYNSLKKYGVENHTFEIIHILQTDNLSKSEIISELNKLEVNYIKIFNSFNGDNPEYGLNLTRGGDLMELTEETWGRINNSKKGRKQSAETISKRAKKLRGRKASPQTIAALIKANTGIIRTTETRQKLREANLGKKQSEETKRKKSESSKGKKHSIETKQKLSELRKGNKNPMFGKPSWNKGLKLTNEETIKKQSESHKGQKAWNKGLKMNPESIEKTASKNRGRKQSPEHIKKAKENRKIKREEKLKLINKK